LSNGTNRLEALVSQSRLPSPARGVAVCPTVCAPAVTGTKTLVEPESPTWLDRAWAKKRTGSTPTLAASTYANQFHRVFVGSVKLAQVSET
jgi:hypothetical protein